MTEEGRQGEFTYLLPLSTDVADGDLMVAADDVSAQISADNENFTDLPMHKVGATWYARLERSVRKGISQTQVGRSGFPRAVQSDA